MPTVSEEGKGPRASVRESTPTATATTNTVVNPAGDYAPLSKSTTDSTLHHGESPTDAATGSTSQPSEKVSNLPTLLTLPVTRSGVIRKPALTKRLRATTKNKNKPVPTDEEQNLTRQQSAPLTLTTSTANNFNINHGTSRMSAFPLNQNPAQQSFLDIPNSFTPSASSSRMFERPIGQNYINPFSTASILGSSSNLGYLPQSAPIYSRATAIPITDSNPMQSVNLYNNTASYPYQNIRQNSVFTHDNRTQASSTSFVANATPFHNSQEQTSQMLRPSSFTSADINLTTSNIAARQAISKDLPSFSGCPEDWPIFITNYVQSTERCGFTDQENLIRLQKCLKGQALAAVKGKLMMPSTVGFAIETLRMLFGRPEIIHFSLQRKLRNEPIVNKEKLDTLITLSLAVQNYCATMQAMGFSDYLNDPMLLSELVDKLPSDLKLDWGRYRITLSRADITSFDSWLFKLATCASQVTSIAPFFNERKNYKKERILVHDVINDKNNNIEKVQGVSCIKCQGEHRLFECGDFISLNVNDRWNFIRNNNLCLRCLKRHNIKKCKSKRQCGIDKCTMPHNSLLHRSRIEQPHSEAVLFHAKETILFKYIPVTLFGAGCSLNTYALIDEGASCSLIESELADQLALEGPAEELCLQWTGEITQRDDKSKKVSLFISDRHHSKKLLLDKVRTIGNLNLPLQTLTKSQIDNCPHLKDVPVTPYNSVKARILIGIDNAKLCVPIEVKEGSDNDLIATRCRIGWGVHGRKKQAADSKAERILHMCACTSINKGMDEMLREYFSLDAVGVKYTSSPLKSKDDKRAVATMTSTTKFCENERRWETGLLWKFDNICMPNSYTMARRRLLCLEAKMAKDHQLKSFLINKFNEYEERGYIRKLHQREVQNGNKSWYIPMFTVYNKNKNKYRIVWDAAAAVENVSLNSVLLKGPDLLKSLVGILIRFRERPVAICGDIREMFHQVRIRKEDQCFQQFLWRSGESAKPIDVYVMNVMTFGASCSPSLANYVKNLNAERFAPDHPLAVKSILANTFVDDWLQSTDTEDEMLKIAQEVFFIHSEGGFEMRNWLSNSQKVISSLNVNNNTPLKIFDKSNNTFEKVLGMWWMPVSDELTFSQNSLNIVHNTTSVPTKREILRVVMSTFDPLGLLGHFIVHAKIILQDIWRSRVGWDEPIMETEQNKWQKWLKLLPTISNVRLPRYYPFASKAHTLQLHTFVDASTDAYAAVSYLRSEFDDGIQSTIIASKTRVAPLKPISVPRMELMAAILGLRLSKFISSEMSLKIADRFFWTDSKDVLYWIYSDARKFQQFVAVRIGEILEESHVSEWSWVPSNQNVADEATKWNNLSELNSRDRWFTGPPFLYSHQDQWPESEFNHNKLKMETICHVRNKSKPHLLLPLAVQPDRFSRWEKLRRSQNIVLQFLRKLLYLKNTKNEIKPFLENTGVETAEFFIYKVCQEEAYGSELQQLNQKNQVQKDSALYKLSPYMDKFGILRIKGRIDRVEGVPFSTKRPIILPQKHKVSSLIIDYYHRKYHHQHNEIVINEIRQHFWIVGLRAAVRSHRKTCQYCKIKAAKPRAPIMAELPIERLSTYTRPFHFTGIDYFGPIEVVVGRRREKRWGVVFTCMTVRAVHIEITSSLSTDSFLLALKQFVSRRGAPCKVLSDNGTNFRGASRILADEVEKISSSEVEREYPFIEWEFIPPAAPHMGGAWERMVRSIKAVMMDILPTKLSEKTTLEQFLQTLSAS